MPKHYQNQKLKPQRANRLDFLIKLDPALRSEETPAQNLVQAKSSLRMQIIIREKGNLRSKGSIIRSSGTEDEYREEKRKEEENVDGEDEEEDEG